MSKEAIDELKRLRSILSGITGLEDDDQEYIEDARKSVDRIIEALAEQPAQQEPKKDLMYSTVAMQERHAAFVDRAVATLEQAKREALAEQPAQQLPFGVGGGLVAIKTLLSRDPCVHANTAIEMIDAILAEPPTQPEQDPVAIVTSDFDGGNKSIKFLNDLAYMNLMQKTLLYTAPPQRTWVGLTDDDINDHWITAMWNTEGTRLPIPEFARAIEAKLKEKNT